MWGSIFTGQGSQHEGMGKFLYENFTQAKEVFEECSDAIKTDLKKLCFEDPDKKLNLTEYTQPALLTTSIATYNCLKEMAPHWKMTSGHSLGEYSSLVSTGTLPLSSTTAAVKLRGQAMQKAVPVGIGAMAALMGLENDEVRDLCRWAREESQLVIEPANFNSPGQVVISGHQEGLQWLKENMNQHEILQNKKVKLIPLKVSAPFHSSLMKPAQEEMKPLLKEMEFKKPECLVVQNVTASETDSPEAIRANLMAQICAPVMWSQSILKMNELGVRNFVEMGPGKVLTGLVKKILPEAKTYNINSLDDIKAFEKAVQI